MKFYLSLFIIVLSVSNCIGQTKYYIHYEKWFSTHEAYDLIQIGMNHYFIVGAGTSLIDLDWLPYSAEIKNQNLTVINSFEESGYGGAYSRIEKITDSEYLKIGHFKKLPFSNDGKVYTLVDKYNKNNGITSDFVIDTTAEMSNFLPSTCQVDKYVYILGTSNYNFLNGNFLSGNEMNLFKIDKNTLEIVLDTVYYNFPSAYNNYFSAVIPSKNGGVYAFATLESSNNINAASFGKTMLCEIDSNGNFLWQEMIDVGDKMEAFDLVKTGDGGFLLTFASDFSVLTTKSWIYKLDENLDVEWFNDDIIGRGYPVKLLENSNNEILVFGEYYKPGWAHLTGVILKLDSSGNKLWERDYISPKHTYIHNAIFNNDDSSGLSGYVCVGREDGYGNTGSPNPALMLLKVNCMGLVNDPFVKFNTTITGNTATFENQSEHIYPDSIDGGHYILDYGDGNNQMIISDSTSFFSHTFNGNAYYQTSMTGYICNDTVTIKETVCIGVPTPEIYFSFTAQIVDVLDSTMLIKIDNSNSILDNYYADYNWLINDSILIENENNSFEVVLPLDTIITIHVFTDKICDSIFTKTESINVSKVVNLVENFEENCDLLLLPNPFKNFLKIKNTCIEEHTNIVIQLYDLHGNLWLYQQATFGENVNTSHMLYGTYVYKLIASDTGEILSCGKLFK